MPRPLTKVRIGYGLGVRTSLNGDGFGELVDELERMRFDSLWLSERIGGEAPDPVSAIAYGAGRTSHLKFGMSVLVLPGRNPIVLAKELATIDRLSGGRLLLAFGLGVADPHEHDRAIDAGHFGALIPYSMSEVPEVVVAGLVKRRPDLTDPAALVPIGFDALVPSSTDGWRSHLAEAATALLPLQT